MLCTTVSVFVLYLTTLLCVTCTIPESDDKMFWGVKDDLCTSSPDWINQHYQRSEDFANAAASEGFIDVRAADQLFPILTNEDGRIRHENPIVQDSAPVSNVVHELTWDAELFGCELSDGIGTPSILGPANETARNQYFDQSAEHGQGMVSGDGVHGELQQDSYSIGTKTDDSSVTLRATKTDGEEYNDLKSKESDSQRVPNVECAGKLDYQSGACMHESANSHGFAESATSFGTLEHAKCPNTQTMPFENYSSHSATTGLLPKPRQRPKTNITGITKPPKAARTTAKQLKYTKKRTSIEAALTGDAAQATNGDLLATGAAAKSKDQCESFKWASAVAVCPEGVQIVRHAICYAIDSCSHYAILGYIEGSAILGTAVRLNLYATAIAHAAGRRNTIALEYTVGLIDYGWVFAHLAMEIAVAALSADECMAVLSAVCKNAPSLDSIARVAIGKRAVVLSDEMLLHSCLLSMKLAQVYEILNTASHKSWRRGQAIIFKRIQQHCLK